MSGRISLLQARRDPAVLFETPKDLVDRFKGHGRGLRELVTMHRLAVTLQEAPKNDTG